MSNKDEKILDAAMQLFARFGLKKTTMDDIARDAGIGKGTIYNYFKNKEEIYSQVLQAECRTLLAKVRAAVRKQDTAADQLQSFLMTRFRYVEELVKKFGTNLDLLQEHHLQPEMAKVREAYQRDEQFLLQGILEAGVESEEFSVEDPVVTSLVISHALYALDMPWYFQGRELKLERKIELLLKLFISGIKKV